MLLKTDIFPAVFWFWKITNQIIWSRSIMSNSSEKSVVTTAHSFWNNWKIFRVYNFETCISYGFDEQLGTEFKPRKSCWESELWRIATVLSYWWTNSTSFVFAFTKPSKKENTLRPLTGCHSNTKYILEICINPVSMQSVHLQQPTVFFF